MTHSQAFLRKLLILIAFIAISSSVSAQDDSPMIKVYFESPPMIYAESEGTFSPVFSLRKDESANQLTIFTRNGDSIYESTEHLLEWNGFTNDHKICQESNYYFRIKVVNADGVRYKYWGEFILIHNK